MHPWTLSAVVVVAALTGYIAWVGLSAWQASTVSISSAELLDCADPGSVVPAQERAGDELVDPEDWENRTTATQAVGVDRRLDCVLRTQVVTRARVPVEVERLTWRGLGPQNGAGVVARWPYQGGPELIEADSGLATDAVFDLKGDGELPDADEEELTQFVVRVRFTEGCVSPGAEVWMPDSPSATIRVLGRTHTITATGQGVAFRGTDESSCDD